VYLKELVLMHSFAFQRNHCLNQLRKHLCRKGIQAQYIMRTELKYSYLLWLSRIIGWFQIVFIQCDHIWETNKWLCNAFWILCLAFAGQEALFFVQSLTWHCVFAWSDFWSRIWRSHCKFFFWINQCNYYHKLMSECL